MTTYTQLKLDDNRLSLTSRIIRLAVGSILIAFTMLHSGTLGALAVLPLLAIYPILTGILGIGLAELLVANKQQHTEHLPLKVNAVRTSLFIVGTGLIGFVMVSETAPVWLALVGIVPTLMAILGSDLVAKDLLIKRNQQDNNKTAASIAHAQLTTTQPTKAQGKGDVPEQHTPKQAA